MDRSALSNKPIINIAYIGRISEWKGQKQFMEILIEGIQQKQLIDK